MKKNFRFLLLLTAATTALSPAQQLGESAAPGTSLAHFAKIDEHVYVGSKPRTDADFQFLQARHIRYILNARFLPFLDESEKKKAARYGIQFMAVPMNASPIPPSEKHVDQILLTLRNTEYQPIYVHCVLGRDRTSLISGLYKIYFLGVSKREAWDQMRQAGFKQWWILRGLKTYFDKHAVRPAGGLENAIGASSLRPPRASAKINLKLFLRQGEKQRPVNYSSYILSGFGAYRDAALGRGPHEVGELLHKIVSQSLDRPALRCGSQP